MFPAHFYIKLIEKAGLVNRLEKEEIYVKKRLTLCLAIMYSETMSVLCCFHKKGVKKSKEFENRK